MMSEFPRCRRSISERILHGIKIELRTAIFHLKSKKRKFVCDENQSIIIFQEGIAHRRWRWRHCWAPSSSQSFKISIYIWYLFRFIWVAHFIILSLLPRCLLILVNTKHSIVCSSLASLTHRLSSILKNHSKRYKASYVIYDIVLAQSFLCEFRTKTEKCFSMQNFFSILHNTFVWKRKIPSRVFIFDETFLCLFMLYFAPFQMGHLLIGPI